MGEKHCSDCEHYIQHYALNRKKLFQVYCGHCIFGRAKQRRPDAKVCENFVPGVPQREAFATKEYLSKELLQYVLNLELLPEIQKDE